jgi:hypothetical protein
MITEYIKIGKDHILDINGIDHILYVATLCSLYLFKDWRKVLLLVTAFTVGHCLTLGLSAFRLVNISPSLVETIIPITIIISALYNIYVLASATKDKITLRSHYLLTLVFGLIHGLGFSNFFKEMFEPGENIVLPLLGFNLGVELGQIVIVIAIMTIGSLVSLIGPNGKFSWTIFVSTLVIIFATKILLGY